jgi:GDP-mannose 4,6 dehydratase
MYYHNNVTATIHLLQLMSEFDCTRLVYSSSATVYGTPPVVPIPETTRLKADSPYGQSKVMCESIIQDLTQGACVFSSHVDAARRASAAEPLRWRAISLRYFNPAGAHPSGLIGEDPRGRPGNLLPLLAHMAIGRVKESVLQVFGNDYPTQCVLSSFPLPHFLSASKYQIDPRRLVFYIVMEHVCVTTYTCSTSLPATSLLSTHLRLALPRLIIAQRLHDSKHITSAAGRASVYYKSSKRCVSLPDLISDIISSAVGA